MSIRIVYKTKSANVIHMIELNLPRNGYWKSKNVASPSIPTSSVPLAPPCETS